MVNPEYKDGFKHKGTFQIAVTAEMFKTLSLDLYSNPHKAILREYATNARDSHVEAGNPAPFDVQLPSVNDPTFIVRDYGTGMTPERIETVCRTYGASTKRETNQFTGKLGLGFKAALGYVGTFAVFSYLDGMLYKYMIRMEDDGIPVLLADDPMETKEPNGVKIQFAVDPKDAKEFLTAATETFPFFETVPNFIGEVKPDIVLPRYVREGREKDYSWKIYENDEDYEGSLIIMGGNVYPMGGTMERSFREDQIHYFVDMDLFEPTPSREALKWGKQDVELITQMRAKVVSRIVDEFKKEVSGMTDWEELLHFYGYPSDFTRKCLNSYINTKYPRNKEINGKWLFFQFNQYSAGCALRAENIPVGRIYDTNKRAGQPPNKRFMRSQHVNSISMAAGEITSDKPITIVLYDAKGISDVVPQLPDNSLVIGTPTLTEDEWTEFVKDASALFDPQRIPYKIVSVADLVSRMPKKERNTRVKGTDVAQACVGAFGLINGVFQRLENLQGYTHYVPFDDETTMRLNVAFNQPSFQKDPQTVLHRVSYVDIATALGMKNPTNVKICYIRPRFVPNYTKALKSWKDDCAATLRARFTDNWYGFMSFLYGYHLSSFLSEQAFNLLEWLKNNTEPWLWINMSYPMTREIAKTMSVHRYNIDRINFMGHECYNKGNKLTLSDEGRKFNRMHETASAWMFTTDDFRDIYSSWVDRFNAEVVSMRRTYPYLFQGKSELLYGALVTKSLQNTTNNNNE